MREFYEVFWEDLKTHLILSFKSAFDKNELSISQKQAVKRLIEKREGSLLNVNLKILSRAPADCITKYLSFLISSNQTAQAERRFISEGGRLFSDILQVTVFFKLRGLVVTVDIQKAFDSINHLF